jgi:hypothetical protein
MPKATLPQGAGNKPLKITRKFKMGGRKSNLSGLSLSTDELIAKLETANGRTKQKIQAIFDIRGFNLAAHLQAQADAVAATEAVELADMATLDATDASV